MWETIRLGRRDSSRERDRSNGDRSSVEGHRRVTAGVTREFIGVNLRLRACFSHGTRDTRASVSVASERGFRGKEKKKRKKKKEQKPRSFRPPTARSNKNVRRGASALDDGGTASEPREFQPPLRRLTTSLYRPRESQYPAPSLFAGYFCSGSHTQSATRSIYAFHCRKRTPALCKFLLGGLLFLGTAQ